MLAGGEIERSLQALLRHLVEMTGLYILLLIGVQLGILLNQNPICGHIAQLVRARH